MENNFKVIIKSNVIIKVLWIITLILIFLGVISMVLKYHLGFPTAKNFVPQFGLEHESNLPTYFSALLLLISALLIWIISNYKNNLNDSFTRNWQVLSFIFLYLSIDEAATVRSLLNNGDITISVTLLCILIPFHIKFLLLLPSDTRNEFLRAATCYVSGALGLEIIEGIYLSNTYHEDFFYGVLLVSEESLEMIGSLLFIKSLLKYLSKVTEYVNIELLLEQQTAKA
ncbi:hypothetical protein [uncultured Pontibacter sp.]|uniref:hypothetical protein n=1 Tax=uncultured Pontibacter sp. TaxID=453356 RepID=UPI0026307BCE|nr:hypothetical protein [uncultured Pontibacter sp.]